MKKFIFDKEAMVFIPIKKSVSVLTILLVGYALFSTFLVIVGAKSERLVLFETIVVSDTTDVFSEEKLIEMLKETNIKFPHIVLAQAMIESGFNSPIFKENNNLFGMKKAYRRPHVQIGENRNHASYINWRMSVIDYALYQCYSLSNIKTEEAYLQYLDKYYAEAAYYENVRKLSEKVKIKFTN